MTTKYDFLDGLRGIAILLVVVVHLPYIWWIWPSWIWIGVIGVPLFFMLSAYTLALSQHKKWYEAWWLKQFFMRRFFRIYPLYILMMCVVFGLWYMGVITHRSNFDTGLYTWTNLVAHLTFVGWFSSSYINSFRVGEWSLFNEVFFYTLFPVLFVRLRHSLPRTIYALIGAVGIYGIRNIIAGRMGLDPNYIYQFPLYHAADFILGFVLFHIHTKYSNQTLSPSRSWIMTGIVFGSMGLVVWAYIYGVYINHLIWLGLLVGLTVITMLRCPCTSWISCRPLVYIGQISYSIYLLNLLILCGIGRYNPFPSMPYLHAVLAMILLILCASTSYIYEKRGISLGRQIS
jgi:peptidoglycan/LPS O-acetylase OafA/YrhL